MNALFPFLTTSQKQRYRELVGRSPSREEKLDALLAAHEFDLAEKILETSIRVGVDPLMVSSVITTGATGDLARICAEIRFSPPPPKRK